MSATRSAQLYARTAILRRKLLLRKFVLRAVAGVLALVAVIAAAVMGTLSLYIAILPHLGPAGAAGAIAGGYLLVAVILVLFAASEPASAELDSLAEMEAAALAALSAETRSVTRIFGGGARAGSLGGTLAILLNLIRMLRRRPD